MWGRKNTGSYIEETFTRSFIATSYINTEQIDLKNCLCLRVWWVWVKFAEQIFCHLRTMYPLFFQQNSNRRFLQSYLAKKKKSSCLATATKSSGGVNIAAV